MTSKLFARVTFPAMIFALSGCLSRDVPEVHYYLLRSDPTPDAVTQKALSSVRLASVKVAPYLDQAGIVMKTNTERVVVAQNYQWSEPLQFSLNNFLTHEISSAYGREISNNASLQSGAKWSVDIAIDQLHGTQAGDVKLVANWTVSEVPRSLGKLTYYEFSKSMELTTDGYDGLIQAEKQLLINLAKAVANSLPQPN